MQSERCATPNTGSCSDDDSVPWTPPSRGTNKLALFFLTVSSESTMNIRGNPICHEEVVVV